MFIKVRQKIAEVVCRVLGHSFSRSYDYDFPCETCSCCKTWRDIDGRGAGPKHPRSEGLFTPRKRRIM